MDLSIVVPCYNELDNVQKLVDEFLPVAIGLAENQETEIVFVDDGSRDGTLEALQQSFQPDPSVKLSYVFKRHMTNLGLGAALRTGLTASSGTHIVTTDSDGTYKFANIPALLGLLTEEVDIVTASPYHPQGKVAGVPAYRLLLSKGSSVIYRILVDWRIHTYTCLFRAYQRKVVEKISFEANGFLGGTELLVKSMLAGGQVVEFPAVLYSRVFGQSKAKIVRTILAHLRFQLRVLLHRLHIRPLIQGISLRGDIKWDQPQSLSFGDK